MPVSLDDLLLVTIAYSDIFDYPLTLHEVWTWAIGKPVSLQVVRRSLTKLAGRDISDVTLCFLPGRSGLVSLRNQRAKQTNQKYGKVIHLVKWYRLIPTVDLVGITGGVAMGNADKGDDIDVFFIAKKGTIWISRILVIFMTDLFSQRRHSGELRLKDRICLNMFLSESKLSLDDRQLYTAHEILQMRPLWYRGDTYDRFLQANAWVRDFLPNAWLHRNAGLSHRTESPSSFWAAILKLLEPLAKSFQLWHMKNRRTTETISDDALRFHPRDTKAFVASELARRLSGRNIPLDKVFTGRIK